GFIVRPTAAVRPVCSKDGATTLRGNCLRTNLKNKYRDPITRMTSEPSGQARFMGAEIHLDRFEAEEILFEGWIRFDPGVSMTAADGKPNGLKLFGVLGTQEPWPDKANAYIGMLEDFRTLRY